MKSQPKKTPNKGHFPLLLKVIIIHIIFLGLHYTYDFFPSTLSAIFSGTNESLFQHMKIGFFSFTLASIVEYLSLKVKKGAKDFIFIRLFTATLFPWLILLIYYIPPAIFGHITSIPIEIITANIILLLVSMLTILVERDLDQVKPSPIWRTISAILYGVTLFLFVRFTFHPPWFDLIAIPPGW